MNKQTLKNDILKLLTNRKISLHKLAIESGVEPASLWRFMNTPNGNLNTDSLFRLWPYIYGAQTPMPVCIEQANIGKEDTHV